MPSLLPPNLRLVIVSSIALTLLVDHLVPLFISQSLSESRHLPINDCSSSNVPLNLPILNIIASDATDTKKSFFLCGARDSNAPFMAIYRGMCLAQYAYSSPFAISQRHLRTLIAQVAPTTSQHPKQRGTAQRCSSYYVACH